MPSITYSLSQNFSTYETAPNMMWENATNYGEKVHDIVEYILKTGVLKTPPNVKPISFERLAANNAIKFIKKYDIQALDVEKSLVWYPNQYQFYSTRSDCLALVNGSHAVIDIKATKNIDKIYVQTQLSAYAYCIEQRFGIAVDDLYIMHLPKEGKPKFLKTEKLSLEETLKNLKSKDAGIEESKGYELKTYYDERNETNLEEIYEIKTYRERMKNYIW